MGSNRPDQEVLAGWEDGAAVPADSVGEDSVAEDSAVVAAAADLAVVDSAVGDAEARATHSVPEIGSVEMALISAIAPIEAARASTAKLRSAWTTRR